MVKKYFKAIRIKNLALLGLIFWGLMLHIYSEGFSFEIDHFLLFTSVIITTASGYLINNYYDINSDKINNKNVELDIINAPDIKSQDDWEKVIIKIGFEGAAKMLVKNTLFNSLVDSTLKLTLNNEFMNLLTKNTKNSIEKTLGSFYSDLTLFIESGETNGSTLSQKESTKLETERKKTEEQFLSDDGLKELEETFNTKVDTKSIKSLKETKNV